MNDVLRDLALRNQVIRNRTCLEPIQRFFHHAARCAGNHHKARSWLSRRLVFLACLLISACSNAFDSKPLNIVFVCQHGYAKSLVAALHFERNAAAHGLNVHVVARGLTPAPMVAPAIISALAKDGFDVANYRPAALTEADLITADHIVSFGVDVPEANSCPVRIDDVPALSEDYDKGRDRIVEIVDVFLAEVLIERQQIEID